MNIRKHLGVANNLDELISLGSISEDIARIIEKSVELGLNIVVSGGTQAGKTTFLNAILRQVPPTERVITIEEVFELKPNLPDWIALQTRSSNLEGEGEISLRRLIKEALRMRPSRIVVGEVREAEALDLLIALNSGLPGMATLHANSVKGAINKLQLLPLLAGENISQKFITPTVANSVDLVIQCSIDSQGIRRVFEISAITGRNEESNIEIDSIYRWNGEQYVKGLGNLNSLKLKRKAIN